MPKIRPKHSLPCPHCDKVFNDNGDLKKHIRVHTGEKPYVCDVCSSAFTQVGALKIHKRVHSGERPYVCEECGDAFKTTGHLVVHQRKHSGEKPYVCDVCGSAFAQGCDLKRHERTHTGEKPYDCSECDAAFAQPGALKLHVRTHTGEKPYNCSECPASFASGGSLKAHKDAMHTPEGQQRQKKQEQRVARALAAAGIEFRREHVIDFTCVGNASSSFARIDFVLFLHGRIVFVEVDENQHRFGYLPSCDMRRMSWIAESLAVEGNTLPMIFIRYNPNAFRVDGKLMSIKKKDREAALVALLQDREHSIFDSDRPLTIKYMYYDETYGMPTVTLDADYNQTMRECIIS